MNIGLIYTIAIAACIGLGILIAYLIQKLTFNRRLHPILVKKYKGIPVAGVNSGSVIFLSLTLAFMFSEISTNARTAHVAVIQEADALRTIGRMSLNINPMVGKPLLEATKSYTEAVLDKEWRAMQTQNTESLRQLNTSALFPLTVMSDITFSPETQKLLPLNMSTHLISQVTKIRELRLIRIESSQYDVGIPKRLLVLLMMLATSIILSLATLESTSTQFISNFLLFSTTFLALITASVEQNPFSGFGLISQASLQEALERLGSMTTTR